MSYTTKIRNDEDISYSFEIKRHHRGLKVNEFNKIVILLQHFSLEHSHLQFFHV